MGQSLGLKLLADAELLAGLSNIVRKGNQVAAELLAYLAELDERQLFLDLGFSSLFEYCVQALALCESTAWRHIAVARLCRSYPEAFEKVADGTLHVSALSLMAKHLNPENAAELFALCERRSTRQVEALLAARFPKLDVRESVRRLPVQSTLDVESGGEALSLEGPTRPGKAENPRRIEPLSADRFAVHFTADREFCELLERARGLAGHRLPSGDLMTLMKRGLEAYARELEKERFAVGRKARSLRVRPTEASSSSTTIDEKAGGRHVPAVVAREVYERDEGRCSFVAEDGRQCSSRRCLELDHIAPWARNGEHTVANLRLRCRAHNQRYARQCYGAARIGAAVAGARERREAATAG